MFLFSAIFLKKRGTKTAHIQFEEVEAAQKCVNAGPFAQIGEEDAGKSPPFISFEHVFSHTIYLLMLWLSLC